MKIMKKLLILCSVLLVLLVPAAVFGIEEEYEDNYYEDSVISYDEALALVLEGVPALIDLENLIEDLKEERYYTNYDYRLARRQWQTDNTEAIRAYRMQLAELDRQIEHTNLEIDIVKLQLEQALKNALLTITNIAISIDTAEATLIITEEYLRRVELLHHFGFASAGEVRSARVRLNQEQMSLDNYLIAQANAQNNLNHLLGQPIYYEIYIEFQRELPELPENLTSHIEGLVLQAPTIHQLQHSIDRHSEERARHLAYYRERGLRPRRDCETCAALLEAYNRAILGQYVAKRAMEAALRTAYNSLEQLQAQEEAARLSLAQAEENLQAVQTSFDLGRVTQFEIDSAELSIFNAQQAIERILYLQWAMVLGLNNPVLL